MSVCFDCPLPDCDDRDKRCLLRKGAAAISLKRKRGLHSEITPEERRAEAERYHVWEVERAAAMSERGVR